MALSTTVVPSTATDAPAVVLLHGFCASADADYLASGWAESLTGRTVIAVDLPAHGADDGTTDAKTTTDVLTAIADAVRAETDGPVDVIGYSLGARLAYDLPRVLPVRKLVLGGLSPMDPFGQIDADALLTAATGGEAAHPMIAMMGGMIAHGTKHAARTVELVRALGAEPFDPASAPPSVPTLVVAGSDDMMTGGIEQIIALLPDAELVRVPGDHRGALDSPEFRATAVRHLA